MSVRSHEAFLEQIRSGKRKTDAQKIYVFIDNYLQGTTLSFIQKWLNLSHGTSTARLSELCDLGVIYEDEFGIFRVTPEDKVEQYAAMREDARYKKWKKLGEKNGWFGQMKIS